MAGEGGVRLGVLRAGKVPVATLAAWSQTALDRPMAHDAVLWVAEALDEATVLGAFERGSSEGAGGLVVRRGSGGPRVRVGPGTLHVALSLVRPDALEPCDVRRIVNRAVRPLLRAVTKTAALAHYFGRDWVSVAHRPVGWAPATLDEVVGRPLDGEAIGRAVVDAYVAKHGAEEIAMPIPDLPPPDNVPADPPWTATVDEVIGALGAGADARGRFRVGGDLLVSRDALATLEALIASAPDDHVGRVVDETLSAPGVALDGVASLASVRDVILRARGSG